MQMPETDEQSKALRMQFLMMIKQGEVKQTFSPAFKENVKIQKNRHDAQFLEPSDSEKEE